MLATILKLSSFGTVQIFIFGAPKAHIVFTLGIRMASCS